MLPPALRGRRSSNGAPRTSAAGLSKRRAPETLCGRRLACPAGALRGRRLSKRRARRRRGRRLSKRRAIALCGRRPPPGGAPRPALVQTARRSRCRGRRCPNGAPPGRSRPAARLSPPAPPRPALVQTARPRTSPRPALVQTARRPRTFLRPAARLLPPAPPRPALVKRRAAREHFCGRRLASRGASAAGACQTARPRAPPRPALVQTARWGTRAADPLSRWRPRSRSGRGCH